jgi:hypothetical protein
MADRFARASSNKAAARMASCKMQFLFLRVQREQRVTRIPAWLICDLGRSSNAKNNRARRSAFLQRSSPLAIGKSSGVIILNPCL